MSEIDWWGGYCKHCETGWNVLSKCGICRRPLVQGEEGRKLAKEKRLTLHPLEKTL